MAYQEFTGELDKPGTYTEFTGQLDAPASQSPGLIASAIDSLGTGMNAARDWATSSAPESVLQGKVMPEPKFNAAEAERLSTRAYAEGRMNPAAPSMRQGGGIDPASTSTSRGAYLADTIMPVRAVAKAVSGAAQGAGGLMRAAGDVFGSSSLSAAGAATSKGANEFDRAMGDVGPIDGFGPKSPAPYLANMAEGAASSLGQSAAYASMFGARAVIPLMSIMTAGDEYDKARNAGLDPSMALAGAIPKGAFEAIGEKFTGLDKVAGAMGTLLHKGATDQAKREAGQALVRSGIKEIPGEVITYLGQTGVDLLPGIGLKQDLTMSQFIDGLRDTVVQAGMMGGAMGATGRHVSANAPAPLKSAEVMARERGFLTHQNFSAPDSPASLAGITPVVVPVAKPAALDAPAAPAGQLPATATSNPAMQGVISMDDQNSMLAQALADAGISGESAAPVAPDLANKPIQEAQPSTPPPQTSAVQPTFNQQPETLMMGRSGKGYATQADAKVALQVGQQRQDELGWKIEAIDGGRFRVAGYTTEPVAAPAQVATGPAAQEVAQNQESNQAPALVEQEQAAIKTVAQEKPLNLKMLPLATREIDAAHLGKNGTPLNEGGKPFKTKDEASAARQLQPMMRVVKSPTGKGFALAPKTEAQLAAQDKAAKRLSLARTGKAGVPTAAHEFIAGAGGMDAGTKAEFSFGNNPKVGNRTLFAGVRGGMSIEAATEKLIEARYLPAGASHSDTVALINRSFTQPQYTVDGTETVAQAEVDARFDDYLAAEQDAAQHDDFDPFESAADLNFTIDDAEMAGYDAAEDPIKLEVNALLAQAGALGIETSDITEQAYEDTRNGSEQDYYDAARAALAAAIETSTGNSRQDAGQQGNAGEQEGLTAPSRAEVLAQQERTDNAQALDDRAQIDAEASRQTLTRQNAPEQRRDTSVDMFGEEKAVLESAKKDADAAAKNEAAKDPNQTGMFDAPTKPEAQTADPFSIADTRQRRKTVLNVLGDGWTAEAGIEGARDLFKKRVGNVSVSIMAQKTVDGNFYVGSQNHPGTSGSNTSEPKTLEQALSVANEYLANGKTATASKSETDATPLDVRTKLKRIADRLGIPVVSVNGSPRATGGVVEIPAEDSQTEGAVTPEHVFAHELGHAIMAKRQMNFSGFPKAEMLKWISNWDQWIAASKAFRPAIHAHQDGRIKRHAIKPNEIIADAIGSVLIGDSPASLVIGRVGGLTERDMGLEGDFPATQSDNTLSISMGGSKLSIDLGKPAWEATDDDLIEAVGAAGFSLGKQWRDAHAAALAKAAKDGEPISDEVLYDKPSLIRDDLNPDDADIASDEMVDVYRETKDYGKAVQAYRDFGKKPAKSEPTESTKESVVAKANETNAFGRTAQILTGAKFKELPGLTLGNLNSVTYENPNKSTTTRDKNKVSKLTSPYVLYAKKPNGDIVVLMTGALQEISDGIDQKIDADAKMSAIVNAEPAPLEPADQATAILDAANITGKERIEALKDVKKGDITPDELKAAYPANESDGKAAESKPSTEATKPPKIEDSGQVLEGARKLYAKNYAAKLDEGTGMDTATVPLSKSWPEPDYQRLIDEGADPWAVAMTRAMRDEVPTKPSSWKLKGWVQKVETLRDMTSKVMSGEMTQEKFKTTGGQFNLADWFNKIDLYEAVGHSKSLKTLKFSMGEYGMYGGQTFKPAKKLWTINMPGAASTSTWASGNWGTDLVVADTKAEAIEKFKAWSEAQGEKVPTEAKATSFDIYSYRSKPGITIVGKRINSTKSIDLKEFTSVKEAREYKAGNQTELEALLAKAKFEPSERGESNAPRVGADHRSGADVTSEQFRETFGFRGEQFGASMPQSERQANMNQAYDALMDLAGVVGIPPKALSLNGELGLAFGARGTGGKNPAAAHYERDTTGAVTPNRVVINLTRKNGAGSLGHEWFHAVDNYFARMRGEKAGMLTESHASRGEGVRPEMVAAFKQLMMAIQSSGVRERSKQLDKKRVKDYWSTGLEMAARSFESYVIAKLQDNNGSNDYLANIVPESLYTMQGSYPYPIMGEMPAIRAAFDNFFGAIQTKETEQGMAMFSRSGSGKSDVLSKDGKFKGWPKFNTWTRQEYSDVVSLLPAAYREDAHRREPVAAKDWDALAAAVLPELEAINNAAGEGAFRLDPLGNIVGDVRRHDSSVFASELVAIANRHDLGIFLTGLRTSSMAPLTEMGFTPEMGLGAILARATGSTAPVMPMASGTVNNTAYGTMMSYRPRGFAAPMFSKAESGASQQPTRGTPVPRVQAVVDAITANWANAPEVVVVSDMQDAKVPQRVREADQLAKSQGAEGEPDGFIYKGTVYLVASELPTINDAIRVLMHESAHAGFRGIFGDTLKPILNQVAAMRRADIVTKAREYGLLNPDTPRGATVNEQWQAMTEKNRQVAAEEVLAVMAQTQPELGFVKRAVAAIRNWLRTNVPGFKSMLMTDADIIQAFILPARRHIEGGQAKAIQPIHDANLAALSRSQDQTDIDNPDIRYSRRVITNPAATGYTLDPETKWLQARRKLQDYFIRVQSVQEAIAGQGGVLNDATNTYLAEERTYGHINETMIDFANSQVEPMVALAAKKGIDANEMSLYAYAKHAQERNERIASINLSMPDGGSGMTNAEAAAILDKVKADGKEADYEAIHQRLMAITAATRLKLLDGGLITQAHFDAMETAYANYVPLRGFELADAETGSPSGLRTGRGFNIRGQETMRALGRSSRAGDLIENVISDFERATIRVERNEVAKVFLNFAQKNPDPTLWQIDANRTKQAYDRTTGLVGKTTLIEKGEDTISCKINGHEIYIQIHDPLLVRALRNAAKDETGEAERFLGKTIGLYSTLLRNTLTRFNPEFAVVNTARDFGFGTVAVLDELGEKGVLKFWKHYAGALAISGRYEAGRLVNGNADWQRWFEEYRASGATTGGFYQQDAAETRKDIRQMMLMAGATPVTKMEAVQKSSPYRAMLAAGRVLEFAGATSEHAARVAAYRTAREMGKTVPQAASIAKNLTTNFNRKGEVGGILNTLFLFFNAGVQGTHRMAKMTQNKRVLAYMAGATAASATLALMNVTMGGEDEDEQPYWDKIPGYIKERNLIIMLPPGFEADGVKKVGTGGRYLMIPMQYGLNIFPALGYSLSDVARYSQKKTHGKSPMAAAVQMGAIMLGAFNPIGGSVDNKYALAMMSLPTALDLPFQLALGVNGFGREVAPPRYNGDTKPNSENASFRQTGGPFQKVAQWVSSVTGGDAAEGGMVDMSPGTYENIWGNLTGGTGRFITDVLALGGKGFDAATGGSPDLFTRDIPIYRKLSGAVDGDVNQGLFYERRSQAVSARAKERAKLEIGRELTNSQELAYSAMDDTAKTTTKSLASIRKQIISLRKDDAIPAPEKRAQERELKATRDELIMGFNAQWMDAMKAEAAGDFSVAEKR